LAKAEIAAAQAGKEAIQAGLTRARSERKRQEALYESHSTTQQKLEAAVADEESLTAQMQAVMPISLRPEPACAAVNCQPKPSASEKPFCYPKKCNFKQTCAPGRRAWLRLW